MVDMVNAGEDIISDKSIANVVAAGPGEKIIAERRNQRGRGDDDCSWRSSDSACSSQNGMSISRYIVVAAASWSRACLPLRVRR